MSFQYQQIDQIADVDEAIAILESEYIPALIEAFSASPEGQALLAVQPDDPEYFGSWVDHLVYFGYVYLEVTLPKMQRDHVVTIVEGLFPQKLMLEDPEQARTAIPELIAFWQFMQREYKHRHSNKILAFLEDIEEEFPAIMNAPSNFGMVKSFMTAGLEAGFDMSTQAGLDAFQEHYNQQLAKTQSPPPGFPNLPAPQAARQAPPNPFTMPIPEGVPPEFVALLAQQMGRGPVPGLEHLPTDPQQWIDAIVRHLVETGEVVLDDEEEDAANRAELNSVPSLLEQVWGHPAPHTLVLSEAEATLLQDLAITETTPGTIVKDFDTLLAAIGESGFPLSGKLQLFPMKILGDLNAQMSEPIAIALQRPQHKSFPNLYGLYLLIRATNIAVPVPAGKQFKLQLRSDIFASWQQLTPTEKYFTLLEAWLIRGDEKMLGESRSRLTVGAYFLHAWKQFPHRRLTFANYDEQQDLNYWPGLYNVALSQLFGLMAVTTVKPSAGGGWRVKKIQPLPLGNAIMKVIERAYYEHHFFWKACDDPTQPWGDLQPYFQPYFPEWQNNLASL